MPSSKHLRNHRLCFITFRGKSQHLNHNLFALSRLLGRRIPHIDRLIELIPINFDIADTAFRNKGSDKLLRPASQNVHDIADGLIAPMPASFRDLDRDGVVVCRVFDTACWNKNIRLQPVWTCALAGTNKAKTTACPMELPFDQTLRGARSLLT